jgi:hypothetical protein
VPAGDYRAFWRYPAVSHSLCELHGVASAVMVARGTAVRQTQEPWAGARLKRGLLKVEPLILLRHSL